MPKASVTIEPTRYHLKSCDGGWVDLRPFPYGKKLQRQEMATKFGFDGNVADQSGAIDVDFMVRVTTEFDFSTCIVDHNLYSDDEEKYKLDFSERMISATLDTLDPRIGTEISSYIDELNGEFDLKDSSEPSSQSKQTQLSPENSETTS